MGDTQQGSSLKVYRTKVVVTDEHFFPIPVDDLVDALAGTFLATTHHRWDRSSPRHRCTPP